MRNFKKDLLLFSMQKFHTKRVLFFVLSQTIDSAMPIIYCYRCAKSEFEKFILGGLYTLEIRGQKVTNFKKEKEYSIADSHYYMLISLRDAQTTKSENDFFSPSKYFSFEETKKLMMFKGSFSQKLKHTIIANALAFFSVALPSAMAVALVFFVSQKAQNPFSTLIIALFNIPLTMCVIIILRKFSDLLITKSKEVNVLELRSYAFKNAGGRKNVKTTNKAKSSLFCFVIASLIVSALSFLSLNIK